MEEKGEKKKHAPYIIKFQFLFTFTFTLLPPESRERTMLQSERRRGTRLIKVKQPGVFVDFVNAHSSSVLSAGFLFNNDSFGGVAVFVSGGFCLFWGEG